MHVRHVFDHYTHSYKLQHCKRIICGSKSYKPHPLYQFPPPLPRFLGSSNGGDGGGGEVMRCSEYTINDD